MILLFLGLGTAGAAGAYLLSDTSSRASAAPEPVLTAADAQPVPQTPVDDVETSQAQDTSDIDPDAPRFDSVRIEPDGNGIIAGSALPGSEIAVVVEGETVAETQADARGSFAAFVTIRPASRPRIMSLVSETDGVEAVSQQDVVLPPDQVRVADATTETAGQDSVAEAVSITPEPEPEVTSVDTPVAENVEVEIAATDVAPQTEPVDVAEAVSDETALEEAGPETPIDVADATPGVDLSIPALSSAPQVSVTIDPTTQATTPGTETTPAPADSALAASTLPETPDVNASIAALDTPNDAAPTAEVQLPILIAGEQGVRVLQPAVPEGSEAEVLSTVALDTISYDASGEVLVAGRMRGQGTVRVYLNNALVAETTSQGGDWQMKLEDVNTGVYTMRIDQVDSAGSVVSRIETPFRREERATLAAVLAEDLQGADIAVRTVQPGNTLWGISRERYGEGTLYVQVFEANRDLIRDPDLIYPGQILRLPQGDAPAE